MYEIRVEFERIFDDELRSMIQLFSAMVAIDPEFPGKETILLTSTISIVSKSLYNLEHDRYFTEEEAFFFLATKSVKEIIEMYMKAEKLIQAEIKRIENEICFIDSNRLAPFEKFLNGLEDV